MSKPDIHGEILLSTELRYSIQMYIMFIQDSQ